MAVAYFENAIALNRQALSCLQEQENVLAIFEKHKVVYGRLQDCLAEGYTPAQHV